MTNRQVLLKSRPVGLPTRANFELVERPLPTLGDHELLVRTRWLSLDPYMRGRMNEGKSYAPPFQVGAPLEGHVVAEVVESRSPGFARGDLVVAMGSWQDYIVFRDDAVGSGGLPALRKLDPALAPPSTAVGVLGMPGHTAYVGIFDVGKVRAGETVVVSAAAGAVGSLAGQLAKIAGARAVGIAGGADKCRYVVEELGFDACVDHRAPDFAARLEAACPKGIDLDFENVGGPVLDAVWPLLNNYGRVAVCGLIAQYNETEARRGPELRSLLSRRINVQGFIVLDHYGRHADFLRDVSGWLRDGRIQYREHVIEGLEQAPDGLIGVLGGDNFGKAVVRVST